MDPNQPPVEPNGMNKGYKRASRRGAPRRFGCEYPGCERVYSRAEHLQRHQLNHNPKEIYSCDVTGCEQKFVRYDLLERHRKRHKDSYQPRNRVPSFTSLDEGPPAASQQQPLANGKLRSSYQRQQTATGPHEAISLLTLESNSDATTTILLNPSTNHLPRSQLRGPRLINGTEVTRSPPRVDYYQGEPAQTPDALALQSFPQVPFHGDQQLQNNFAAWLFDPQTNYKDFDVAGLPFFEGGLESTFNNDIHYDYESLHSRSPMDSILLKQGESMMDDLLGEPRRQEVLYWFRLFCNKQPKYNPFMPNLLREHNGDLILLNVEMMRRCLAEYWECVSPRLPILHQHTFSANRCHIFLLCVMLALGAASIRRREAVGQLREYGAFADVIISIVRWEIVTCDESAPPASLWVAQSLLLIEFYEKLFSSRRFHERAHIYHPSFLTLLRRGSPLIGRAGSESPPELDDGEVERSVPDLSVDSQTWWVRWAETESMHRVVFAAFMLDITHAAMFGHTADMAAHEIRLPLPCDDQLWMANSPDTVRRLDANFRMYGVKQVTFLDGLKNALHGKEVKTHSFGRMIILAGLLNVAWHLNHKESHLKWLDLRVSSQETQNGWRPMVLRAFDNWKQSFDTTVSNAISESVSQNSAPNGPIKSAAILFQLAHISLRADIVDCQIYAGAKRVLGRKVSSRDHMNAVKRMSNWSKLASTRQAVLHAYVLLNTVLVEPIGRRRNVTQCHGFPLINYTVHSDPDPHGPWILYYATLIICAFVHAAGRPPGRGFIFKTPHLGVNSVSRTALYLSRIVRIVEMDENSAEFLHDGLLDLIDTVVGILAEVETELIKEARERLENCRQMLIDSIQQDDA